MKRVVLFAMVITLIGCERKLIVEPNNTDPFIQKKAISGTIQKNAKADLLEQMIGGHA